jgi:endonuclease/exonuclease/phosphatase family metal-dependent hydrolase
LVFFGGGMVLGEKRLVIGVVGVSVMLVFLLGCQGMLVGKERGVGMGIRVMTFNVRLDTARDGEDRWELRRDFVVSVIRDGGADILGTQEPLPHQVAYLEKELPEYQRLGVGRDDGKEKGEFSALFLRKARFVVKDSGTFWLSETPTIAGSKGWGASYPRIATWARVTDKGAGRELMVVNAHLDHKSREAQLQGARLIRDWLREKAAGMPVIFTGDLNTKPDSPAVQAVVEGDSRVTLVDAFHTLHPEEGETSISDFNGRTTGPRIDYVFCTAHFLVREARIVRTSREGRYPSDHYPVSVELSWK